MDINFGGFPRIIMIENKDKKKKYSFSNVSISNDDSIIKITNILTNFPDNNKEK